MEIIFAAFVSAFAQWLKRYMPNQWFTLGLVALLSVLAAGIYTALVVTGFWETALRILTISGAIYTFIIARFESSRPSFSLHEVDR